MLYCVVVVNKLSIKKIINLKFIYLYIYKKYKMQDKDNKNKTPIYIKLLGAIIGMIVGVTITVLLELETQVISYVLMAGGYYGADYLYKNK